VSENRYAEQWLVLDRKPLNMLTLEDAKRRHASRESCAALIGDPDKPSHVVSLVGPWVTVSFLDADLREYLLYSFKEVRPGRLFLKQAIHRQFSPDSGEVSTATIFAFSEKGSLIMERQNMKTNRSETRKAKADPTPNWDRYPEFGAYDSLLREERS
jgi:hypothetical protein